MKQYITIAAVTGGVIEKYKYFDTESDADEHVAEHGGFVALTPEGSVNFWIADPVAKTLVLDSASNDAASLERAKDYKARMVNAKRAELEAAGISYLGSSFKCDGESSGASAAKLQRLRTQSAAGSEWVAIDDAIVAMTFVEFEAFATLMGIYNDSLVIAGRTHKNTINAMETTTAIDDYNINENW